jgi:tetratricopeptide (TPR) repeat protein
MGRGSQKTKKASKIPRAGRARPEGGRNGPASKTDSWTLIIIAASVAIVTFMVFFPALRNGFVSWDDNLFVYENPHIRSLDFSLLKWAFTNQKYQWSPLRWISHAVDYKIWQLNPLGHHLSSIIFHALNAFLVVVLTVKLLEVAKLKIQPYPTGEEEMNFRRKALIAGVVTGLLFGIHPLRVESVAWVSERKDMLFAFFFLLSLIAYLRYYRHSYNRREKHLYYMLALVFFLMSVMSKATAVTLPLVLILLDLYPLERVNFRSGLSVWRRIFVEKLPFFAIGGTVAWINIGVHEGMGFVVPLAKLSFIDRILLAVKTFAFYLMKMIWPFNLTLIYGLPYNVSMSIPETAGLLLFFAVVTASCIFLWFRGKRLWLAVWIYYIVMLLPLSVIKVFSSSFAHDRYTYMPSIGPFLLIGLATAAIYEKVTGAKQWRLSLKTAGVAAAIAALISLSYITIRQTAVWKNSLVFWSYVIEKAPVKIAGAYYNLGNAYYADGLLDKAIEQYETTLRIQPGFKGTHYKLGIIYQSKGLPDLAIQQYETALRLNPDDMEVHNNLGVAYQSKGLLDKATEQYQKALSLSPDNAQTHCNLGNTYLSEGLFDKAIQQYQTALRLKPDYEKAYKNMRVAYMRKGLKNETTGNEKQH